LGFAAQEPTEATASVEQLGRGHAIPLSASILRQHRDLGVDLFQGPQVTLLLRDELGLVGGITPPGFAGYEL